MKRHRICPAEIGGILDIPWRKFLHNPKKILSPFIRKGMTVMDLGCGPGFFTRDIAEMVGDEGKVIAVDVQQGMLDRIAGKLRKTSFSHRVECHLSGADHIGWKGKADFIFAFYVVHEVLYPENFLFEWEELLNEGGSILIAEPLFHVKKKDFYEMVDRLVERGWKVSPGPKIRYSRSVLVTR